ncbi:MAG TPA: hypothetical protein VFF30_15970 [Nitrososphaerales archaeon]|nr:hypothetical protein [Nitrososphaerales archaeon]
MLFASALLAGTPLFVLNAAAASSTPSTGYSVSHFVEFNTYGQFSVNETLNETPNATTGLSAVTFGLPPAFVGHIADLSAYSVTGSTRHQATVTQASGENNTVLLTVSLQPALQAGTNASVRLGFFVLNSFKPINGSNYNVPMMFYPSVNMSIDKMTSRIYLPYLTTHVAIATPLQKFGFSQTVNGSAELWSLTLHNSSITQPGYALTNVYSDPSTSGAFDFTLIQRQLSVGATGSVVVNDYITVKNLGMNTVTSLRYAPLTNSTSLTVLPSSEPPLSNVATTTLSGGSLNLNSINRAIEGNSSETIILQYPLEQTYWNYSNGIYHVEIPASAPVNAIVDRYQVVSKASSGIILSSGTGASVTVVNTSSLPSNYTLSYRLGVGSAFSSALPVAALASIAVFLAVLIFRPRTEAAEDVSSTFDALVRTVEDKVSGTNDILSELRGKRSSVTRNDLLGARARIDELRSKTGNRIGVLRSQIATPSVSVQAGLNQLTVYDRDFDRSVRDILNSYDQFISRKMKEDTFSRVLQNYDRRLQTAANSLLDSAHDLREEHESET